jgi:hydroxymethylglutaryl-CoA reductase (NADPH)
VVAKQFVVESPVDTGVLDEAFWSDAGLREWQIEVVAAISSQIPNRRWSFEDVCVKDPSASDERCLVVFDSSEQQGREVVTIFLDAEKLPEQDIRSFIDISMDIPKITINSTHTRNSYIYTPTLPSAFDSAFSAAPRSSYSLFPATSSLFYMPTDVFARTSTNARRGPQEDLTSIKWIGYAVRALGVRFWLLAKNADSADIFVVLLGYVLMHLTFVRLFLNMRKMGSSFWLRKWSARDV